MARPKHIDEILRRWDYDPDSLSVRTVRGSDGRDVLQMRIELGLLQIETSGRPDGQQPHGFETYFDYLTAAALKEGDDFELSEEQCIEVDREFIQFYHRRICWLSLRKFNRGVQDAEHTLGLMDFCRRHSTDDEWILSHEQYRPFVLFHRIQAGALAALDRQGPETAVQSINQGLQRLRKLFIEFEAEEQFEDDDLVARLVELRESLREQFNVGRTLQEQLNDAIAREQYELAARLRDQLSLRGSPNR